MSVTDGYATLDQVKQAIGLPSGDVQDDGHLERAIEAASRLIDRYCGRRFHDDGGDTTRYYTPVDARRLVLEGETDDVDLQSVTSLSVDLSGTGTYTAWAASDYVLGPYNAGTNSRPYTFVEVAGASTKFFPVGLPKSVEITGRFGWAAVPVEEEQACELQAARIVKRATEAPFGVAAVGFEGGGIRLLSRLDPDVELLLRPLCRKNI